jgi:hypothetical protein
MEDGFLMNVTEKIFLVIQQKSYYIVSVLFVKEALDKEIYLFAHIVELRWIGRNKMSIDTELRSELPEDALVFDNLAYDKAIIGITTDDRVVYDYDKMVEDLVVNEDFTLEEAIEWIDYNTIGILPYSEDNRPIVMYPIVR